MKEFRFFFAILFFVLLVMCFTYHSRLMPFLLATVFIMCGFSYILGFIARFCFTVKVKSDVVEQVRRKDEVTFQVTVKNNFILPLTPVRVYVKTCVKDKYVPQKKMLITTVAPFKEVTFNVQNAMSFRGQYHIGLVRAEFFDILKIFRFGISWENPWTVISYPREQTLDNLRDDNEEETEVSRAKAHGFNKDVFSHLREYREGESLRHIHWKISAKLDELIVKQMESNYDFSALVFCDFTSSFDIIEETLEVSDTAIETSQAIIRRILLLGNSAHFFWQDRRVIDSSGSQSLKSKSKLVLDTKTYGDLANSLALLPPEPFEGKFTELINEHREEIRLERAVYIVTASVNDELVKNLRETGLMFRKNVVLAVIFPSLSKKGLIDYIKTQTKIVVCSIENDCNDCGDGVKSFNEEA
jgi:uncharacterized protein (DUF58 family)